MSEIFPNSFLGLVQAGLAANRPTAPNAPASAFCFYLATDTGVLSLWNGTAWVDQGPFNGSGERVNASVAATGSTVTDAAPVLAGFTVVTGADATKGVVLPTAPKAGTVVTIKNSSASALKVWPDAAATINAIGSNADLSFAAQTCATLTAVSATQWYSSPLVPS